MYRYISVAVYGVYLMKLILSDYEKTCFIVQHLENIKGKKVLRKKTFKNQHKPIY